MHVVHLRLPEDRDFPVLQALRNDRPTQLALLAHPEARDLAVDDTRAWIERRCQDENGAFFAVDRAGACVGFVQLHNRHRLDRHAYFGVALVRDVRGQGVGEAAMAALVEKAIEMGLRKLLCEVRADNLAAINLYDRIGFERVGILRDQYCENGHFVDVMLMENRLPGAA